MASPRGRPVPDDFAEVGHMSSTLLRARYGCGLETIMRWRRELGIKASSRPPGSARRQVEPAPDDFVERRRTMTRRQLAAHYGRSTSIIHRWIAETRAVYDPPRTFTPQLSQVPLPKSYVPSADDSAIGRAKRFLMRKFSGVFDADILPPAERAGLPNHGKGIVIVGGLHIPASEIVDFAVARGMGV